MTNIRGSPPRKRTAPSDYLHASSLEAPGLMEVHFFKACLSKGLRKQRRDAEKGDSDTRLLQTSCPHIPAYYMQDTCSTLVQDLEERQLDESLIIKRRSDWSVLQIFCLINE